MYVLTEEGRAKDVRFVPRAEHVKSANSREAWIIDSPWSLDGEDPPRGHRFSPGRQHHHYPPRRLPRCSGNTEAGRSGETGSACAENVRLVPRAARYKSRLARPLENSRPTPGGRVYALFTSLLAPAGPDFLLKSAFTETVNFKKLGPAMGVPGPKVDIFRVDLSKNRCPLWQSGLT